MTPWTIVCQVPLSMEFSRLKYWSELPSPFPSPGDLPDPGFEPRSPALQADALSSEPPAKPRRGVISKGERRRRELQSAQTSAEFYFFNLANVLNYSVIVPLIQ